MSGRHVSAGHTVAMTRSGFTGAYAHIMGRAAYEGMAAALPTADHPFSPVMNAARQVVFSRTLRMAWWANTVGKSGANYQVEVEGFWDSGRPETCASWLPWTMAGSAPSGR